MSRDFLIVKDHDSCDVTCSQSEKLDLIQSYFCDWLMAWRDISSQKENLEGKGVRGEMILIQFSSRRNL